MNFHAVHQLLDKHRYYVFSLDDLRSFYPQEKRETLKKMMYRWRKRGWISSLKKGLYELTYPKDFHIPDLYIAARLYAPSYVSLETALSYYSMIPEVSMGVTCITTKPTRRFKNRHGFFIYHTVRPECFKGYYLEKNGAFDIFLAEPEKALVDWLYFKSYRSKSWQIENERLDRTLVRKLNKNKLNQYAKLYKLDFGRLYAHD